jgi:hypothetical protein
MAALVALTQGKVWIISKADRATQRLTRAWLAEQGFYPSTGIDPSHLRFCEKRSDKRAICIDLGLTHFVDDSPEVIGAIAGCVPHYFLFGGQTAPEGGVAVQGWVELMQHLKADT